MGRGVEFQSTHPVRGATVCGGRQQHADGISIHAPREGCDQSRHQFIGGDFISIHAPREGCDSRPCTSRRTGPYFNPRTP